MNPEKMISWRAAVSTLLLGAFLAGCSDDSGLGKSSIGALGLDPATFASLRDRNKIAQRAAAENTALMMAATDPTWINLGPFAGGPDPFSDASATDAGRIRAIVTHPSDPKTLYLATTGGVFKSTNADETASTDWTWTTLTDNLPVSSAQGNVAVGDLAMDPNDPNTLYLGLGDPPGGIDAVGFFISHDGGATWAPGGTTGNATLTWKILPISSSVLLVGTNDGIWRSTDSGQSFSAVTLGGSLHGWVQSIARFADGTLVASYYGEIYYSTDLGVTWSLSTVNGSPVSSFFGRITLAAAASGTVGYMIASESAIDRLVPGLFKTTDSGRTFAFVTPSDYGILSNGQAHYNQLLAIDPADSNHVWAGAEGLFRTLDGGTTWSEASNNFAIYIHPDFHTAAWSKTHICRDRPEWRQRGRHPSGDSPAARLRSSRGQREGLPPDSPLRS